MEIRNGNLSEYYLSTCGLCDVPCPLAHASNMLFTLYKAFWFLGLVVEEMVPRVHRLRCVMCLLQDFRLFI